MSIYIYIYIGRKCMIYHGAIGGLVITERGHCLDINICIFIYLYIYLCMYKYIDVTLCLS